MTHDKGPSLAALVRQNAQTSQLFGIDFVPAYRKDGTPPARHRDTRIQSEVETKPLEPVGHSASTPPPQPALSGTKAARLEELRARYIADAPHAPFIKHFKNIVFGEGDPGAQLVFVGEAPGEDEDRTGRPFVGKAGQLLDKMIVAMGLRREDVYICNLLKVRPPNNATPTIEESAASEPYLMEQLDIIAPKVIVALGRPASLCLLKTNQNMSEMRGRWHTITLPSGLSVSVMPTYHPAFLLRSYTPENRGKVWNDLQLAMAKLKS